MTSGFPSPADDYAEGYLNLQELLVKKPAATFFVRMKGDSMCGVGIFSGDLLIVDRSLSPQNQSIILLTLSGEFLVRRWVVSSLRYFLYSENPNIKPLEVTHYVRSEESSFQIFGVVTYAIRPLIQTHFWERAGHQG